MTNYTIGRQYHQDEPILLIIRHGWTENQVSNRFRLVLVESDKANQRLYVNFEDKELPVVFCLNLNEPLDIKNGETYTITEIIFHPLFLNPAYESLETEVTGLSAFLIKDNLKRGYYSVLPSTAHRLKGLFGRIEEELEIQNDAFWPCRSRSYLIECLMLIERLYLGHIESKTKTIPNETIDAIMSELLISYQNPPSLQDLSERYHINRTSLSDQFKESTGQTISDYISNLRLRIAKDLLLGTALPISEISERVGFDDPSSFYRYFKRKMRLTPLSFRESNTWL